MNCWLCRRQTGLTLQTTATPPTSQEATWPSSNTPRIPTTCPQSMAVEAISSGTWSIQRTRTSLKRNCSTSICENPLICDDSTIVSFSRPKLSSLQSLLSSPTFVREALCDRYLNRFETALYDETNWRDYAEESNWINWFLAIELIRNVKHSYHSSSWMFKVNKTSSSLFLSSKQNVSKGCESPSQLGLYRVSQYHCSHNHHVTGWKSF